MRYDGLEIPYFVLLILVIELQKKENFMLTNRLGIFILDLPLLSKMNS